MSTTRGWARIGAWSERVSALRVVAGVVAALLVGAVLAGWRANEVMSSYAGLGTVSTLQANIEAVDRRVLVLETNMDWITRTLDAMARRQGIDPGPAPGLPKGPQQ